MKIGIIGSGHIGGTLAKLWKQAGYDVMISSRHPEKLQELAKSIGATTGKPEQAAQFGEIILLSIPLGEIPNLSKTLLQNLAGKIVMDTCNPYPERDGNDGVEALNSATGSGVWVAQHLPDVIVVKAFNTVYYKMLASEAHRKQAKIGIPLAADDKDSLETVAKLVEDAGFEPVMVGDLTSAKDFDNGTPPYASNATASELKKMLNIK